MINQSKVNRNNYTQPYDEPCNVSQIQYHEKSYKILLNYFSSCDMYGMPARRAYPSGHLLPSPFLGLAYAPFLETRLSKFAVT